MPSRKRPRRGSRCAGVLDAIVIPAYGDSVSVRDGGSGATVFSGFVRSADASVSDSASFLDSVSVSCQGHNETPRYRIVTGTEGVEIVEAADGEAQFGQIVALLDGYTGATDLDSNSVAIRTDIRYQTGAAVLRALAVANAAILHVTTGSGNPAVPAGQPDRVRARPAGLGGPVSDRPTPGSAQGPLPADSALRNVVAQREINGRRRHAGLPGRPLNRSGGLPRGRRWGSPAERDPLGDQGLRFREDADVDVSADLVEFFGGGATDATTPLYIGGERNRTCDLVGDGAPFTTAKMRLRATSSCPPPPDTGCSCGMRFPTASDDQEVEDGGPPDRDDSIGYFTLVFARVSRRRRIECSAAGRLPLLRTLRRRHRGRS